MLNEKISIIVPVYNVERFLSTCVLSLINQNYSNLEILLIDDGSTDQSGAICDDLATRDERIIVIHKSNGGLSSARNTGIERVTGDFIAFVDSDDFVAPDFLKELYEALVSEKADISECAHCIVSEDVLIPFETSYNESKKTLSYIQWITETDLRGFLSVVVWNKLYRRHLWEDIRFPEGRVYEDDSTTYKVVFKAKKVCRLYNKLYYYRQRSTSITKTVLTEKKKKDNLQALDEQIDFFARHQEQDLSSFAKSKKCLLLISYWFRVSDRKEKKEYRLQVKALYREIKDSGIVPLKYKRYIRLFLLFPMLSKILNEARKVIRRFRR